MAMLNINGNNVIQWNALNAEYLRIYETELHCYIERGRSDRRVGSFKHYFVIPFSFVLISWAPNVRPATFVTFPDY